MVQPISGANLKFKAESDLAQLRGMQILQSALNERVGWYSGADASRRPDPAASGITEPAGLDAVRGPEAPLPGKPRITALGIKAAVDRTGSAALVGRTVAGADDLKGRQRHQTPHRPWVNFFVRSASTRTCCPAG